MFLEVRLTLKEVTQLTHMSHQISTQKNCRVMEDADFFWAKKLRETLAAELPEIDGRSRQETEHRDPHCLMSSELG